MPIKQSQIKINLSNELKAYLESKADRFGVTMSSYVKHLILQDASYVDYPVYTASKTTESAYRKARGDSDKLVQVDDVKRFLQEL